jgi:hypothetical protein
LPESNGRLSPTADPSAQSPSSDPSAAIGRADEELLGPDRGREHAILYAALFAILTLGSLFLRGNVVYESGYTAHSVMESIATVLAFIVGALALVRYYSRKQITFLLIGCGFLGAALLDLNHALRTGAAYLDALVQYRDANPESVFLWSWTAERTFLSLFLFGSLLAWRQEVREAGGEVMPEGSVYVMAFIMTIINLLFFELVPLGVVSSPAWIVPRPFELFPALLFLLAFIGFYRKGSWRRDSFEHWLLVSLLLAVLAHGVFMALSLHPFDAMFDAAHLL